MYNLSQAHKVFITFILTYGYDNLEWFWKSRNESSFPEARNPSYKLKVDFGKFGIKQTSAQITHLYKKEDLVGKQVIAVTNFPSKQIARFMSECLVLGVVLDNKEIVLLQPERTVPNGSKIA